MILHALPACASLFVLEEYLPNEWTFHGYVVSDCGAIYDMRGTLYGAA